MSKEVENQAGTFVDKYYRVLNKDYTLIHSFYDSSSTRGFVNAEEYDTQRSVLFFNCPVGIFDPDMKAEVQNFCVEPLNDGLLVVVKGASGGSSFSQTFYLIKNLSDLIILKDVVCFLSYNAGKKKAETAVNVPVVERNLSEVDAAVLKRMVKDFSDSLLQRREADATNLTQKVNNFPKSMMPCPEADADILIQKVKEFSESLVHCIEADAVNLKQKVKDFYESLLPRPEGIVTDLQQKLKEGSYLAWQRNRHRTKRDCSKKNPTQSKKGAIMQSILVKSTMKAEALNRETSLTPSATKEQVKVCIINHLGMLEHRSRTNKEEVPGRVRSIMKKLKEDGVLVRCQQMLSELADVQHVLAVHDANYFEIVPNAPLTKSQMATYKHQGLVGDIYFSKGSRDAALLAAGSVVQGCKQVAEGLSSAAFAIVRPPGHHALSNKADGFCILNNVAIGARYLRNRGYDRIMIIDYDIHHGNGSQQIFYDDRHVLIISVHSSSVHYPRDKEDPNNRTVECVGEGEGTGFNINVNLPTGFTDSDMFYVIQKVVCPVASEFNPDFILISAGYDALKDDPLGDAKLTPECIAKFVQMLKTVQGRLVLSLEGGYDEENTAKGVCYTVRALLGDEEVLTKEEDFYKEVVLPDTVKAVKEVMEHHKDSWHF